MVSTRQCSGMGSCIGIAWPVGSARPTGSTRARARRLAARRPAPRTKEERKRKTFCATRRNGRTAGGKANKWPAGSLIELSSSTRCATTRMMLERDKAAGQDQASPAAPHRGPCDRREDRVGGEQPPARSRRDGCTAPGRSQRLQMTPRTIVRTVAQQRSSASRPATRQKRCGFPTRQNPGRSRDASFIDAAPERARRWLEPLGKLGVESAMPKRIARGPR